MGARKMKAKPSMMTVFFFQVLFASCFPGFFSAANLLPHPRKSTQSSAVNGLGSTLFFPVNGNVYPLGYFSVTLNIGNPPRPFELDIDTGSDVTWVQCDAPCTGCTLPRDRLYKPQRNLVPCKDPLCTAVHYPGKPSCQHPDQCDFEVSYADQGSVIGVLVKDQFPLTFINRSRSSPQLTFGCGYDLQHSGSHPPPPTAGVLGLSKSSASFSSQLRSAGITQNIIGHCFNAGGGGFLFIGGALVPSSGVVWTPILSSTSGSHYLAGQAEILLGGKPTGIKGMDVIFDSGTSYTYFTSTIYKAVINLVKKNLEGKPLNNVQDKALSVCWKGAKRFKSISDVRNHFSTLSLSFSSTSAQLQLPPEAYLIISESGNVCLGILNGTEAGLGNQNLIGDISMQDKLVIYDNEKQRIGWAAANCKKRLKF